MSSNVTIVKIDYNIIDMSPTIILDNGEKLKCRYNNGGNSYKSTTRRILDRMVGRTYKSIDTLKWYLTNRNIVKIEENKRNMTLQDMTILLINDKKGE